MIDIAGIIILGILAQWLAWRLKIPAILPLILTGLLIGPLSTFWTADGEKLLNPIFDESTGRGLFPGKYLFHFVALAIGIILFEGGLTLKIKELRGVGKAIGKLISVGSLVTFVGATIASHYLIGLPWGISYLFGGLIIVTGPTVITPILQNVPLNRKVATVLKWEGILIDPIGALVAVLVFELLISGGTNLELTWFVVTEFFKIIFVGTLIGAGAAYLLYFLLKKEWIPHYLLNVLTLAFVLLVFVESDILAHESGLLSVVVMGMVLGNLKVPNLKEILSFKESLSVLLISILFILLSANINMEDLRLIFNIESLALFLVVILVLRPIGVFLSTRGSDLSFNEKLFISWVGPRGIVAAGVASLFGLRLMDESFEGANYITPLVFMIVLGTVLLNAASARLVARLLGVVQTSSNGVMIVGANLASRLIGKYLAEHGRHVVLIDSNEANIEKVKDLGLEGLQVNIYTDELKEQIELTDVGYLIAMTSSTEVNEYALRKHRNNFGEMGAFRLISPAEMKMERSSLPEEGIFSYSDDYLNINEVVRDYPFIHEQPVNSNDEIAELFDQMRLEAKRLPLFIKQGDGFINVLPSDLSSIEIEEGTELIYMGKALGE